ncbi:MAG: pyridoxal 5'-phosphate synthase glutaminase subunit PdxT [Thermoanaerobaculales bacterium]
MTVVFGVLALQGDWEAHGAILTELGCRVRGVRTRRDLDEVVALVLPGGESSAMLRLMEREQLVDAMRGRIRAGMPVLATCAGVILLAEKVHPAQPSLGLLSTDVERNAYGRQVHSTVAEVELEPEFGRPSRMEGVFIRAPRITRVGGDVEVLGRWQEDPVLVRQGRLVAATFHPELTSDRRVHELLRHMGEKSHV